MKTLYIAGPMTGLPEFNFPAFFDAEERLRQQGYLVNNPATIRKHPASLTDGEEIWRYYMTHAIPMLLAADGVALLQGWQNSKGAKLEVLIAQNMSMPTWDYEEGRLYEPGSHVPLDAVSAHPAPTPTGGS